jgi:hypothetical protein
MSSKHLGLSRPAADASDARKILDAAVRALGFGQLPDIVLIAIPSARFCVIASPGRFHPRARSAGDTCLFGNLTHRVQPGRSACIEAVL